MLSYVAFDKTRSPTAGEHRAAPAGQFSSPPQQAQILSREFFKRKSGFRSLRGRQAAQLFQPSRSN
jgi:hypothetical protein